MNTILSASENKIISANIRKKMEHFGTSVTRIADVIGQDKSTVSRKLNNKRGYIWTHDDIKLIAALYEIAPAELLPELANKKIN